MEMTASCRNTTRSATGARDVVARAIVHNWKSPQPRSRVYLDLTHLKPDNVRHVSRALFHCLEYNVDINPRR